MRYGIALLNERSGQSLQSGLGLRVGRLRQFLENLALHFVPQFDFLRIRHLRVFQPELIQLPAGINRQIQQVADGTRASRGSVRVGKYPAGPLSGFFRHLECGSKKILGFNRLVRNATNRRRSIRRSFFE